MKQILFIITIAVLFAAGVQTSDAASTKIFGGGKVAAPTATPKPQQQPLPRQQVKTSLPVYNTPQNVKTTPPTGPETLPLVGLATSFAAGLYLKVKTKKMANAQ